MADVTREDAIDAFNDALSDLRGAADALAANGAAEELDIEIMISRVLYGCVLVLGLLGQSRGVQSAWPFRRIPMPSKRRLLSHAQKRNELLPHAETNHIACLIGSGRTQWRGLQTLLPSIWADTPYDAQPGVERGFFA